MPKIDVQRLRQAVKERQAQRPVDIGPGGHRITGNKALVRDMLAEFDAMRAVGARWIDIAAALAKQGITQGDGEPITTNRLTALVSSVRKENQKRAAVETVRAGGTNLPTTAHTLPLQDSGAGEGERRPSSADIAKPVPKADPLLLTEDQIRQAVYEKHAHLFKKG